ncbi:MAG: glutamate racemase, partial [Clostridia bacterium]|nr:glutamate racemase [Clostridia bacterium]
MSSSKPIAVFDSGVGGISVLRELYRLMPNENFIYFGDSANAPYGSKRVKEVMELSVKNAEMLMGKGAKALVIACNTATSVAASFLREKYPDFPIIGVEPALKPAVLFKENSTVAVMATPIT